MEAQQAGLAGGRWNEILGASCVETSEARLRAADGAMICFFIARASQESKGKVNYIAEAFLSYKSSGVAYKII